MDLKTPIRAAVARFDDLARPWAARGPLHGFAYEFLLFGLKQAWACLFGGAMVTLLVASRFLWPQHAPLARYDFLVLAAVAIQAALLWLRLERPYEALTILVFHLVGTAMELFKTSHGSWIYPEPSLLRIGHVPLFSGFMYACVGSYIARAWRLFEFEFTHYPPTWATWALALGAYVNFFTDHWGVDLRLGLFAASVLIFWRTWVLFRPYRVQRRMPLLVGFLLVTLFIWFAENAGTFAGAWIYPSQRHGWHMVAPAKMGSWYLLMILSFVLVRLVHRPKGEPPLFGGDQLR